MKLTAVLRYNLELGGCDRTSVVEKGEMVLENNIDGSDSTKHSQIEARAKDIGKGFEAVANFINQRSPTLKLEVGSRLVFTSEVEL